MVSKTKYALITGCGHGGIGEALAHEYRRKGIHAIATVLPNESSKHLTEAGITWFTLDVTKRESIMKLREEIFAFNGGNLDILVNNAFVISSAVQGICYTMTAIDTDVEAVQRMFNVNVFGPMRMLHHFHDLLIKSKGTIVSISSIGGIVPYVYGSSYNATKAALTHWSNTVRLEMAPLGVNVVVIISGEVGTNILKNDHGRELPEGSYYSPLASEFKKHVHRTPPTTDRFIYARNVVARTTAQSPPAWFWTGSATSIIRFMYTFLPLTSFDYLFWNMFNLGALKTAHNARMQADSKK